MLYAQGGEQGKVKRKGGEKEGLVGCFAVPCYCTRWIAINECMYVLRGVILPEIERAIRDYTE